MKKIEMPASAAWDLPTDPSLVHSRRRAHEFSLDTDWRIKGWESEEWFLLSNLNLLFAQAPHKTGHGCYNCVNGFNIGLQREWPEIKEKARQVWERIKTLDQGDFCTRNRVLISNLQDQINHFDMGNDAWIQEILKA